MNSRGMKVEMTFEDYNLNVTRVKFFFQVAYFDEWEKCNNFH